MLTEDNIRRGMTPRGAPRGVDPSGRGCIHKRSASRGTRTAGPRDRFSGFAFCLSSAREGAMVFRCRDPRARARDRRKYRDLQPGRCGAFPHVAGRRSRQLVAVRSFAPRGEEAVEFSYPLYTYLREQADAVAGMLAYASINLNLSAGAVTESPEGCSSRPIFQGYLASGRRSVEDSRRRMNLPSFQPRVLADALRGRPHDRRPQHRVEGLPFTIWA